MNNTDIEYKLRVFISSRCGEKYTIARKALKKLLLSTGLVHVYAFETAPASSEDTQSAYLQYIDDSNLCIFLVDNEDDVSPAVFSEEKRAKDKQLRLLYLFCDENKKEATPMQEELRSSFSQKYQVVHEFSDIVAAAYDSVMQDIIAVYKKKDKPFGLDNDTESITPENINTESYSLSASCFATFPLVGIEFTKRILPPNPTKEEPEGALLDKLFVNHLQTVLYLNEYDPAIIDSICSEVVKEHSEEFCSMIKLRFQAQKNYYSSEYDDCLMTLQNAISIAIKSPSIPTWIANDIAIDIRFIQGRIDEKNNQITIENPGQKYIDESNEPVYFPYLDRQVENMQDTLLNKYYTHLNDPPYTMHFGGLDSFFTPLANTFCIAQLHGSIVQTELTRERLITIYSTLSAIYEDHDIVVEYIRLLITNRNAKKLDDFIRTYNQSVDILNGQDIDAIQESINIVFNPIHQVMSKYLLASRLGYYMNDDSYSKLYKELIDYAMDWVHDDSRIYNVNTYIFDFFKMNTHRINKNDIIAFILEVFDRELERYYFDCFKVLRVINFSDVDFERQNRIKQLFIDIAAKQKGHLLDQFFSSAIIRFCKTTKASFEELEVILSENYPDFYKKEFLLEVSVQGKQDFSAFVNYYLEEAKSRNVSQGLNGTYSGFTYECLDVVYNIISAEKIALDSELLKQIIEVGLETLAAENQTVQAKRSAVRLLQLVYFRDKAQSPIWEEVGNQMVANISTFSVGHEMELFSKETNYILSFQYKLFVYNSFIHKHNALLEMLFLPASDESYIVIMFLAIIAEFLNNAKGHLQDDALISAFLYYSIFMTHHKERDAKYHATICLVELTNYPRSKQLALMHLSQLMDSSSEAVKIAILTRLDQIHTEEDDSYVKQIINKGKADNNYIVRYAASRTRTPLNDYEQL